MISYSSFAGYIYAVERLTEQYPMSLKKQNLPTFCIATLTFGKRFMQQYRSFYNYFYTEIPQRNYELVFRKPVWKLEQELRPENNYLKYTKV